MTITQTAIKSKRGWHRSMPLPKEDQAIQYRRILNTLGNQTQAPIKTANGYVIRWRAKIKPKKAR